MAGCQGEDVGSIKVARRLAVAGPQIGVERFVSLQRSRRPALPVSPIRPADHGNAQAIVTLPAHVTGQDLIHTTREALAAGLDYRFEERTVIAPPGRL